MLKVAGLSPAKSLVLDLLRTARRACLFLGLGRACSVTFVLVGRFLGTGGLFGWLRAFLGRPRGVLDLLGNFIGLTGRFLYCFFFPGRPPGVGVGLPPRIRNIGVGGTRLGGVFTGVLGRPRCSDS